MSNIRRQSIISSLIIYVGFALGFFNTWLFVREGSFTQGQYGLIGTFIAIGNVMYSFASLGMATYIYKFYPYYNDNLPPKKNDLVSWALVTGIAGFILVIIAGVLLKDLVIRKYVTNAPDLVKYYYWLFPFGFGLTIFSLLEAYSWQVKKSVLTNYLREIQFRIFTTILIIIFTELVSSFDTFIKVYSFTYLALALILLTHLLATKKIHFTFSISRVTRKFFKKILGLVAFVWSGGLIYNIASVFDTLVIAAVLPNGLAFAGVYTLAQNIASLIQAPQRGIISASIGPLSRAWKDKDFERIQRIYQRSSINLLIFSVGMFMLILLNFQDGVFTFELQQGYLQALPVFLIIGIMRILDLGTGLNSQIIATSTYWRFEFYTGIVLLGLALPLNYFLTKSLGVIGPAISNLIAFTIYNGIRYYFLLRKFDLQPFNSKTLYTLLIGLGSYLVCHFSFRYQQGFFWIVLRSSSFALLYVSGILYVRASPDLLPVWQTVKKKFGKKI